MIKQLTTLALGLALSSIMLGGSAQACHKPKCPKPVVAYVPAPVAYCAPAPKKACFKLPKVALPKLCHKKAVCTTVAYAAPAPSAQSYATPQH